jgi:hypothetical protein
LRFSGTSGPATRPQRRETAYAYNDTASRPIRYHEFVLHHFCLHLIDNVADAMCVPGLDGREVPAKIKDHARVP